MAMVPVRTFIASLQAHLSRHAMTSSLRATAMIVSQTGHPWNPSNSQDSVVRFATRFAKATRDTSIHAPQAIRRLHRRLKPPLVPLLLPPQSLLLSCNDWSCNLIWYIILQPMPSLIYTCCEKKLDITSAHRSEWLSKRLCSTPSKHSQRTFDPVSFPTTKTRRTRCSFVTLHAQPYL